MSIAKKIVDAVEGPPHTETETGVDSEIRAEIDAEPNGPAEPADDHQDEQGRAADLAGSGRPGAAGGTDPSAAI